MGAHGRITTRGGVAYTYDLSGRRTADDRFSYVWDWRGQLVEVTVKDSWPDEDGDGKLDRSPFANHQVRYSYDAAGRLLTREHRGAIPEGGTDADRPFFDLREHVWDGEGLTTEVSWTSPERTAARWRKTYVPGASGLDDAVQVLVEVGDGCRDAPGVRARAGGPGADLHNLLPAGHSRPAGGRAAKRWIAPHKHLRPRRRGDPAADRGWHRDLDELRRPRSARQGRAPERSWFTLYAFDLDGALLREATRTATADLWETAYTYAESGPELARAYFDADAKTVQTSGGSIAQTVADERAAAAGSLALDWTLPLDSATLPANLAVERLQLGLGWLPMEPDQVAIGTEPTEGLSAGGGGPPRLLVMAKNGWQASTSYRVRSTQEFSPIISCARFSAGSTPWKTLRVFHSRPATTSSPGPPSPRPAV